MQRDRCKVVHSTAVSESKRLERACPPVYTFIPRNTMWLQNSIEKMRTFHLRGKGSSFKIRTKKEIKTENVQSELLFMQTSVGQRNKYSICIHFPAYEKGNPWADIPREIRDSSYCFENRNVPWDI